MITIFTTAKPFTGHIRTNQLNALRSWKALHPDIEIILFGEGEGYHDVVKDLGLVHVPGVRTSEKGTPLVNSMFDLAGRIGRHPIQAYVNCDIILMDDFMKAVLSIDLVRFLMVGQRWDIDMNRELEFSDGWQERLRDEVRDRAVQMHPSGIDYLLYKRGIWEGLPDMVVGRAGYDDWLIYYCRKTGIPVVDASESVIAVHQNHDYSHVKGGKKEVWAGDEAKVNLKMAGGYGYLFTISDADFCLKEGGLSKNYCRGDWLRCIEVFLILHEYAPLVKPVLYFVRRARNLLIMVGRSIRN